MAPPVAGFLLVKLLAVPIRFAAAHQDRTFAVTKDLPNPSEQESHAMTRESSRSGALAGPEELERVIKNLPREPEVVELFKTLFGSGPLPPR
jgi:hypothetical protein